MVFSWGKPLVRALHCCCQFGTLHFRMEEEPSMSAMLIFGISAIAFRDFLQYYWRALSVRQSDVEAPG